MTTRPRDEPELLIGGYRLLARIGEGGMGVVHLARRGEDGERVALKVLRPQVVGDDDGRARLKREVDSLSRVHSRWVAEIVDADPWDTIPWIATRYVPGPSLHDHVEEEGPVTGADLLWFAGGLAEGLDAVHAAGVLHRDVKPSNVLMEGRSPILIDFGLAKLADDPRLTQTGWLIGTPGYLAPEILHGDDATEASDVHAWAATVAFAGTGRAPFGRGPSAAVMDRVRRGEHDLTGLTGDLAVLVAAGLDPDPSRRPPLEDVLDWLRPQTTRVRRRPVVPPLPATVVDRWDDDSRPPATLVQRADDPTVVERLPWDDDGPWPADSWPPEPERRVPVLERVRRAVVQGLLGLVVTGLVVAFPLVSVAVLLTVVWLLRSGSLAASTVGARRELRGRRWWDGPRLLLGAPWDLVRSIPSTLVLQLWALGLALSAGLLCYAVAVDVPTTLVVSGVVLVAGLWWGPGGSRVRSPVGRAVRPLARRAGPWAGTVAVLAALAVGSAYLAETGPDWTPLDSEPWQGLDDAILTR